jgi:predicted transport protein
LKDTIENSQNILLIIDEDKPELKEVSEVYTDTWDKIVQVEILKHYTASEKSILALSPDFEDIGRLTEGPKEGQDEGKYSENFHLEDVDKGIVATYERIRDQMIRLDSGIRINPQKYYISIRKKKNFAFISLRKKKMSIVIMLPYETGNSLIKQHKLTQLSEGVQSFYGGPCFRVTIENEKNTDEIVRALEEAYRQQNTLT